MIIPMKGEVKRIALVDSMEAEVDKEVVASKVVFGGKLVSVGYSRAIFVGTYPTIDITSTLNTSIARS